MCRACSPPDQLSRSPLYEPSDVAPPKTGVCRRQLPRPVKLHDYPLVLLGGDTLTVPSTDPLSLSRSGRFAARSV